MRAMRGYIAYYKFIYQMLAVTLLVFISMPVLDLPLFSRRPYRPRAEIYNRLTGICAKIDFHTLEI